jgi:hypothetical protein
MFSKFREDTTRQSTNDSGSKLTKSFIDTGVKWITGVSDTENLQYQQ